MVDIAAGIVAATAAATYGLRAEEVILELEEAILAVVIQDITVAVTTVTAHTTVVTRDATIVVVFLGNRFGAETFITRPDIIHTLYQLRKTLSQHVARFWRMENGKIFPVDERRLL